MCFFPPVAFEKIKLKIFMLTESSVVNLNMISVEWVGYILSVRTTTKKKKKKREEKKKSIRP